MPTIFIKNNKTGIIKPYLDKTHHSDSYIWEKGNYSCDCNRALFFDGIENYKCDNGIEKDFLINIYDENDKLIYSEFEYYDYTDYKVKLKAEFIKKNIPIIKDFDKFALKAFSEIKTLGASSLWLNGVTISLKRTSSHNISIPTR